MSEWRSHKEVSTSGPVDLTHQCLVNIYIFKNSWKTWKESCKIYSIYVNVCVIIRERILTFRITKQEICIFQT